MATNNFLIDSAQSAGTIANNIFNKAGNFASQGLQYSNALVGNDVGLMETPEMKDYLKNLMLKRIKESGNLSGNELGYSDYDTKSQWSAPDSLSTSTGLFSPNAAYQNTLGSGSFSVPEQGGDAKWKPSSTVYDFSQSLADKAWGLNPFNVVNRGGLKDILLKDSKGTYKDGTSSLQHMIPNAEITPEEIQEIFGGGGMLHKGEGEPWQTGDSYASPEINSLNSDKAKIPTIKPTTPVGTSATALAQIQANISAAKTKERLSNKSTKKTTATSGMMSSGGPPRRGSRRGRKKTVTKPSKSSYGRRYGL